MTESKKVEKIANLAMMLALSLIFSYVEFLIPISIGVPGIKLGLANLVVLIGLFFMKPGEVLLILLSRITLAAFLFGNMSTLLYSLAGGLLSMTVMLILKKTDLFSMVGVSIAGAVIHNLAQLGVAVIVVENTAVLYYMPFLLLSGSVAGLLVGLVGKKCVKLLHK